LLLLFLLLLLLLLFIALPCALLAALSPDLTEALRDDLMVGSARDVAGWRARMKVEDQTVALSGLGREERREGGREGGREG